MSRVHQLLLALADGGPNDPPDWCFKTNANGDLPTCSYDGSGWHRSYESAGSGGGGTGGIVVLIVIGLVLGGAFVVWQVSTARRMARESGMSESDATAMTLLSDDGFEATYLASSLRPQPTPTDPPPVTATNATRLRELRALLDEGLIDQAEHDARRQVIIDSV
jgi:hypothetical protein